MANTLRPASLPDNPASPALAAMWMVGTVVSFVLMIVAARELVSGMSAFQVLSFRSLVGIPIMCVVAARLGFYRLRTRRAGFHVTRNVFHFGGQWCWVVGISILPLAHVTALEFTMPLWTFLIAMIFLGERLNRSRTIAVICGFAGVMIILRPGIEIVTDAALIVLAGAFMYGVSNVMMKSLTGDDPPWVIVFWMQVIQLPLALIPAVFVFDWVTPTLVDVPWLLLIGVTGLSAHFCLARAFSLADASVCIPVDFIRLPFTAFVGWLVYAEGVSVWVLSGAALIFGSNYYSVWRETRRNRR